MKKLLLIAAATAAFSSSALADQEGTAYLRLDGYAHKFVPFTDSAMSVKLKSFWGGGIEGGAGYYFMENVRGELVYTHPFNVELKKSYKNTDYNLDGTIKHKAEIHAVFAKAFAEVTDMGIAKLYAGGGLGWARLKEKVTFTLQGQPTAHASTKAANQFAWTIGAGVGAELAEGVTADLQYAYTDFGKTKGGKAGEKSEFGKNKYRMHAIKLGVRFAIPM